MIKHSIIDNIVSAALGVLIGLPVSLYAVNQQTGHTDLLEAPAPQVCIVDMVVEYPPAIEAEDPQPEPEPDQTVVLDPDIPEDIQIAAMTYGELNGICPEFLEAIAWTESRFDPEAVSGGCTGLMQVSLRWHRDRMERLGVTEEEMLEVGPNMMVAADYLRELFDKYEDPGVVLMYYNGDSNAEAFTRGECDISEYADSILQYAEQLERRHGK